MKLLQHMKTYSRMQVREEKDKVSLLEHSAECAKTSKENLHFGT